MDVYLSIWGNFEHLMGWKTFRNDRSSTCRMNFSALFTHSSKRTDILCSNASASAFLPVAAWKTSNLATLAPTWLHVSAPKTVYLISPGFSIRWQSYTSKNQIVRHSKHECFSTRFSFPLHQRPVFLSRPHSPSLPVLHTHYCHIATSKAKKNRIIQSFELTSSSLSFPKWCLASGNVSTKQLSLCEGLHWD